MYATQMWSTYAWANQIYGAHINAAQIYWPTRWHDGWPGKSRNVVQNQQKQVSIWIDIFAIKVPEKSIQIKSAKMDEKQLKSAENSPKTAKNGLFWAKKRQKQAKKSFFRAQRALSLPNRNLG